MAHVAQTIQHLGKGPHGMECEIVEAVDGKALSTEARAAFQRHIHRPRYPFVLSDNEIACFHSHRRVWQMILEQNLDAGLILEDDAALSDDFAHGLPLALSHYQAHGFIRFPFRDGREEGPVLAQNSGAALIEPIRVGLGMVVQLVSREAASRLLKATERFDRPVDVLLQMPWVTGVVPVSIVPGGVREISSNLGGTTLGKRRGLWARLQREIMRPLYRSRIAHRSKREYAKRHR